MSNDAGPIIDDTILNIMLASNMFGGEPTAESLGDFDKRLNYAGDINKYLGLYVDDLLGLEPEPDEPGAAPVLKTDTFRSDLRNVYRGNELFEDAFAAIESGSDPFTETAFIMEKVKADSELEGLVPGYKPDFDGRRVSEQNIASILSDFAEQYQREIREQTDAQMEFERASQVYQDQVDEYNRHFSPAPSEFEQMGSPTVDAYLEQLGLDKLYAPLTNTDRPTPTDVTQRGPARRGRERDGTSQQQERPVRFGPAVPDPLYADYLASSGLGGTTPTPRAVSSVPGLAEGFAAGLNRRGPSRRGLGRDFGGLPTPQNDVSVVDAARLLGGQALSEGLAGSNEIDPVSKYMEGTSKVRLERQIRDLAEKRLESAKQNVQPSTQEMNNRKKMAFAYALQFGEAPPINRF
jgi:hypothetical protein